MNAAEIRSLYVETLARAYHAHFGVAGEKWEVMPESLRAPSRRTAGILADALAEAGLLPTGVEKRAIDGGEKWVHVDGSHSVLAIYGSERRYFTDWREVSE